MQWLENLWLTPTIAPMATDLPRPPSRSLASESGYRHCVRVTDLQPADLPTLYYRARHLQRLIEARQPVPQTLAGRLAITCFLEPSTRTRVSFEAAALRLGMQVISIGPHDSSLAKGESDRDTRLTLESYWPDALIVRSKEAGLPQRWAAEATCAILNGGDGAHEHPSQALYDRYTLQEAYGDFRLPKLLFVGDIAHSRVAGSHVRLAAMLGLKVYLAGPPAWTDVAQTFSDCPEAWEVVDLDEFLPHADAICALRVQLERGATEGVALEEYIAGWQLDAVRLARAKPSAILLHPAPVNRGVELADDVVEGERSWIQRQGGNGQVVRMALLEWTQGVPW